MSKRLPRSVPILSGSDFCGGILHEPETRSCHILGHSMYVFTCFGDYLQLTGVDEVIYELPTKVIEALVETSPRKNRGNLRTWQNHFAILSSDIAIINDDMVESKDGRKGLARWWNRAMAYLGYTEGNPEAK